MATRICWAKTATVASAVPAAASAASSGSGRYSGPMSQRHQRPARRGSRPRSRRRRRRGPRRPIQIPRRRIRGHWAVSTKRVSGGITREVMLKATARGARSNRKVCPSTLTADGAASQAPDHQRAGREQGLRGGGGRDEGAEGCRRPLLWWPAGLELPPPPQRAPQPDDQRGGRHGGGQAQRPYPGRQQRPGQTEPEQRLGGDGVGVLLEAALPGQVAAAQGEAGIADDQGDQRRTGRRHRRRRSGPG